MESSTSSSSSSQRPLTFRPIEGSSRHPVSPTLNRHRIMSGGCCLMTTTSTATTTRGATPKLSACWRRSTDQGSSWSSTGSRPSSRGAASTTSSRPSSRSGVEAPECDLTFQKLSVSHRRAAFKTQKWSHSFDHSPLTGQRQSVTASGSTASSTTTKRKSAHTWSSQGSSVTHPKSLDSGYMGSSAGDLVLNAWMGSCAEKNQQQLLNTSHPVKKTASHEFRCDDLLRCSSLPSFGDDNLTSRQWLSIEGRRLSVLESMHDLSYDQKDDEEVERIVANIICKENEEKGNEFNNDNCQQSEAVSSSSEMHLETAMMAVDSMEESTSTVFHATKQWSSSPMFHSMTNPDFLPPSSSILPSCFISDVLLPSDTSTSTTMESRPSSLTSLTPIISEATETPMPFDPSLNFNLPSILNSSESFDTSWTPTWPRSTCLSSPKSGHQSPMSPMMAEANPMDSSGPKLPVFASLVKDEPAVFDSYFLPNNYMWKDESVSSCPHTPDSRDESNVGLMDENRFVCLWLGCNLQLSSQRALVEHINETHMDNKKGSDELPCLWKDCPRKLRPFNAKYKLLTHMRVHTKEKPYKCEFEGCQRSFARLENRKIHFRSHTGHKPFECKYASELGCTKRFSNSSDRAKHEQTHKDPKPYRCEVHGCPKRYTDPSSLRKHVKSHSQEEQEEARRRVQRTSSSNTSLEKVEEKVVMNNSANTLLTMDAASILDVTSEENNAMLDQVADDPFALLDGLESLLELEGHQSFEV